MIVRDYRTKVVEVGTVEGHSRQHRYGTGCCNPAQGTNRAPVTEPQGGHRGISGLVGVESYPTSKKGRAACQRRW